MPGTREAARASPQFPPQPRSGESQLGFCQVRGYRGTNCNNTMPGAGARPAPSVLPLAGTSERPVLRTELGVSGGGSWEGMGGWPTTSARSPLSAHRPRVGLAQNSPSGPEPPLSRGQRGAQVGWPPLLRLPGPPGLSCPTFKNRHSRHASTMKGQNRRPKGL